MIHIADTKVERRYGDFFIRQIHKFEEVRKIYKWRSNESVHDVLIRTIILCVRWT